MRQPTQGQVIKKRVWCFIEALLTHAEDSPDFEIGWKTDKSTGNPIFEVNTKRRFLLSLTGLKTTELTEVIKSLENLKIWDDRRPKQGQGSQIGAFALKLWSKDAARNQEQFERVWEASRPEKSKALEANYQKPNQIDWHNICKTALEKRKEATTNRLLDSEMIFDLNQIHVPLALVERKKQDKRQGDDLPENSHSYKPEYEETQKFEYEEFLAVLKTATNKKIAIIGEPGAGKTTLLQRIAFWVLSNTDDLAIWIPLGNLPITAQNFKDYLLNNWLQNAIQSITPEIKADFDKQLSAGKVWLLLDGVDEMAASGNALSIINNWLPAWSQNLHFVLTCRLNIWEANPNYLSGFQTYRTLEFNQEQVKQFINNCFQTRRVKQGVVAPELGIALQQALNQPGKERIKDLVRNPLRLMLLCSIWHSLDGKLPDTKAELYELFVKEVYEWKKDELGITPPQRRELTAKLKELALAAIDKEENRFSLRQKFVETVLGECDDELFQFALRVGWLNRVGVDGKNKTVYAFFHPTFQEYFAALEVKDWRYFLNHVPDNPAQGIYRIFEPQWKEVFLLWLGREDVAKEEKEEFIKELMEFDDGLDDPFYGFRAYFLAGIGISEFKSCSLADAIVEQIINCGFGYYNLEKQERWAFFKPIEEGARTTLQQTNSSKVISGLLSLFATTEDQYVHWRAAESLGKIDPGNQQAIAELVHILETIENEDNRWKIIESLDGIDPGNERVTTELAHILETIENEDNRWKIIGSFIKLFLGNQQAITTLVHILQTTEDKQLRLIAASCLEKLGIGDKRVSAELVRMMETTEDTRLCLIIADILEKIAPSDELLFTKLTRILETSDNVLTCQTIANLLEKVGVGNEQLIVKLVRIFETSEKLFICRKAADILEIIGIEHKGLIAELSRILETSQNNAFCIIAAEILGKINPGNQRAITELVWILDTAEDEDNCWNTADSLGKIDPGNQLAITKLVQVLEKTENEYIYLATACSLGEIDPGNEQSFAALVRILETTENELIYQFVCHSLGEFYPDKELAIAVLVWVLEMAKDKDTYILITDQLGQIGTGNEQAITALIWILEMIEDEDIRVSATQSLGKIGTGNEQAIAALLRILKMDEYEDTHGIAARSLGDIGIGNDRLIAELLQNLEASETHSARNNVSNILVKIGTGDERIIAKLIRLLEATENKYISWYAADNLKKIIQNNQMQSVVSVLQHHIAEGVHKTNLDLFSNCYNLIWHCAQNMTFPDFHKAWHSKSSPI